MENLKLFFHPKWQEEGHAQKGDKTAEADSAGSEIPKKRVEKEPRPSLNPIQGEDHRQASKQDEIVKNKVGRKEIKKYEKNKAKPREDESDAHRKIKYAEIIGNRKDFLILSGLMFVVVVGIVLGLFITSRQSTQKVYALIEQRNYASALGEIQKRYEKGKNVDSLVFKYAEECAENSEYRRAVHSLQYLSSAAVKNEDFFMKIMESFFRHGKENRAEDVIYYLQSRGGEWNELAVKLFNQFWG